MQREIHIILNSVHNKFGYGITVDGKHACSGSFFKTSVDAYLAALQQLLYNAKTFHLRCPDPFADDESKVAEDNITDDEHEKIDKIDFDI